MPRLIIVLTVFFCGILPGQARASLGVQAILKPAIVVEGEAVTLGDLFNDGVFAQVPEAAKVPIVAAPHPGDSLSIDAISVQRFAAAHNINWPNTQGLDSVKIERASQIIDAARIETTLLDVLADRGMTGRWRIRFSGPTPMLHAPLDAKPTIAVDTLDIDARTGQFRAKLRTPADDQAAPLQTLTGRAYAVTELPMLSRDIKPGETITANDLIFVEVATDRLGQTVVTRADDLVGTAAKRMLRREQPLRLGDVEPPILIKRNAVVAMSVTSPGMSLTAEGRALEDGALGGTIRVMNTSSKRTVEATVIGSGLVAVGRSAATGALSQR